jgi:hypothetical protein
LEILCRVKTKSPLKNKADAIDCEKGKKGVKAVNMIIENE